MRVEQKDGIEDGWHILAVLPETCDKLVGQSESILLSDALDDSVPLSAHIYWTTAAQNA